jgi:hypothetical protein
MTVSGQISYEHRIVAQAFIDFTDPQNFTISKFGFAKFVIDPDQIRAVIDVARWGLISGPLVQGQTTANVQIIQPSGAPPVIALVTTDGSPGSVEVQVVKPTSGGAYAWTDGVVTQLNILVGIVDGGPFWPQSNP